MNFTVYNKFTGQILKTGSCPADHFDLQAQDNEVVEGIYPDDKYYWDNGFIAMPLKPEGFYNFDYTTKTWVLNTTQTIRANKAKRNSLLLSSDWTQLLDVNLTNLEKQNWQTYRQSLRDMSEEDYLNNQFPIAP